MTTRSWGHSPPRVGVRPLVVVALVLAALLLGIAATWGTLLLMQRQGPGAQAAAQSDPRLARWPGATHIDQYGQPYGWPHTKAGAVDAATAIVILVGEAPTGAAEQSGDGSAQLRGAENGGLFPEGGDLQRRVKAANGAIKVSVQPISWNMSTWSGDKATVQVWAVEVATVGGTIQPVSRWFTATVELGWDQRAYSVYEQDSKPLRTGADWLTPKASEEEGPTPERTVMPLPGLGPGDLAPQIVRWQRYPIGYGSAR